MSIAIINSVLVGHDALLPDKTLIIDEGKISEICDSVEKLPADATVYDAHGQFLSPGFIDMHTHGGGGHDFMDGTEEALRGACLSHMLHGTTSICPTTLTCLNEELFTFFEIYKKVKTDFDGPELLGIHLEGPFFNAAQAGAQDPKYLQLPLPENYNPILEAGGKDIVRVSAAAELEGGMQLGEELRKRGIIAAIGHSDATYQEVELAVQHGYHHVTHLYSGMSGLHRVGPYRVLGLIESSYLIDGLTVEIIADGKHLPPELLRLIVKCKGIDKISLITDSMRGAGMKEGQHVLIGSLKHGQDTILKDGVAMMPDFKAFAGSVCTTDRCVRTMVQLAGVSLPDAVRMMTYNPATLLGVADRKGSLLPGMDADLVIFDKDIQVKQVFVRGQAKM